MTTSWLTFFENKPQDQQQLHSGQFFWSNKIFLHAIFISAFIYMLEWSIF